MDDRTEVTPGFKFNEWELRGVPLRLEIGPKDVANHTVALARRDIPGREGKSFVSQEGIADTVSSILEAIQINMLVKATQFRDENIHQPQNYEEFKEIIAADGWCYVWWKQSVENEARVKEDTRATLRCLPWSNLVEKAGVSSAVRRRLRKPISPGRIKPIFVGDPR